MPQPEPRAFVLFILLTFAVFACSKNSDESARPNVAGGPCEYQSYSGTCRFREIGRRDTDGHGSSTLVAHFAPESGTIAHFKKSFVIADRDEPALRAWLAALPAVPCDGKVIVRGSCNPEMSHVGVPPFAPTAVDPAKD